jgi:hypothetical protein
LLTTGAVEKYLAVRFPASRLPTGLAQMLHQRTEGNPLFMVSVVEDWVAQGLVAKVEGWWELQVGVEKPLQ